MAKVELDPAHAGEIFLTYPYLQTVALTCSSVVMGSAERAVDLFAERIKERVLAFSGNQKQIDQPFAQMRLGEEIGRAHVCTPVTNAHIVCRLLLEKKKKKQQHP